MDSQQEVSTKTDMDDSDSAPTTCFSLSSNTSTSNNGHKAPQNTPANYNNRFKFKGDWNIWHFVWIAYFLPAVGYGSTPCNAGYRLEKHRDMEVCVPCKPNTFMPEKDHRNEACFLCREKEPEGSLTQIIWPCTWTSNTKIGCLREKGKESYRHNGKDSANCVPCRPRCKEGEIEIQQCTEYTNRQCQKIPGGGSDSIPPEIDFGDKSEETDGKTVGITTLPPPASISTTDYAATTPPPSVSDVTFERGCKEDSQKPPQNCKDGGTNNEFPSLIPVYVLLALILTGVMLQLTVSCYNLRKQRSTHNLIPQ